MWQMLGRVIFNLQAGSSIPAQRVSFFLFLLLETFRAIFCPSLAGFAKCIFASVLKICASVEKNCFEGFDF